MSERKDGRNGAEDVSCLLLMACGLLITLSTFLTWINLSSFMSGDLPRFNVTGWDLIKMARASAGNPFGLKMNGPLATGMFSLIAGLAIILCAVLFLKYRRALWKVLLLVMVAFSMTISIMTARTIGGLGVSGQSIGAGLFLFIGASCAGLVVWLGLVSGNAFHAGERTRRSLIRQVGWRFACGASLAIVGGALIIASVFLPWTTIQLKPIAPSSRNPSGPVEHLTGWDTVALMGEDYGAIYATRAIHGNPFYMWEQEVAMFSGATILIAASIILILALALLLLRREWLVWSLVLASIYLLILTSINFFSCVRMVGWAGHGVATNSNLAGLMAPSYSMVERVTMGSGMWLLFTASLVCPIGAMMAAWGLARLSSATRQAIVPVFRPSLRLQMDIPSVNLRKAAVAILALLIIGAAMVEVLLIQRPWHEKPLAAQPVSPSLGTQPADTWITDGSVSDIAMADSTAYIGGDFDYAGPVTGHAAALDLSTGAALPGLSRITGNVYCTAADGAGGWYVGGKFSVLIGKGAKGNLIHILADGGIDESWNAFPNGPVRAMAVSAGTVYIGGDFQGVSSNRRDFLAAVGPDGQLSGWSPAADGKVYALFVDGDTIYAGGDFSQVGGVARQRLAAVGKDGAALGWNPGASGKVNALVVRSGTVYAGGEFDGAGGEKRSRLAAIGKDGKATGWDPGADGPVLALAASGNVIYAGGTFAAAGGAERRNAAAIGPDGRATAWNPGFDDDVRAFIVKGGTVYAGGDFTSAGGEKRLRLAAIGTDGRVASWPGCADKPVHALALSGGSMLAGGEFTSAGGLLRENLAAIGPDGVATAWNPGADGPVEAMLRKGGTIYACGNFATVGGQPRSGASAVDLNGRVTGWDPDVEGHVEALTASEDLVYLGGNFDSVGGRPRDNIACVDLNGDVTDWDPGADKSVLCLAVDGETVYAGGGFERIGGEKRKNIAAIDSAGKATRWKPEANDTVYALAVSGDTIYAGGKFTSIGGKKRSLLAAIGPDGKATPWNPNVQYQWVGCLSVDGDLVYAGGYICEVGGEHRACVAMIGPDGRPTSWKMPFHDYAFAMAVEGSSLYVGGTIVDSDSSGDSEGLRHGFARFDPVTVQFNSPTQTSSEPDALQLYISQASNERVQVEYTIVNPAKPRTYSDGLANFEPGKTSAVIAMNGYLSGWGEPGETLTVTLSEPEGAILGKDLVYTFIIRSR